MFICLSCRSTQSEILSAPHTVSEGEELLIPKPGAEQHEGRCDLCDVKIQQTPHLLVLVKYFVTLTLFRDETGSPV